MLFKTSPTKWLKFSDCVGDHSAFFPRCRNVRGEEAGKRLHSGTVECPLDVCLCGATGQN